MSKNNGLKTCEGRLEDGRTNAIRKGTYVYYMCWSHSTYYIVTSPPIRHKTVLAGIQSVGMRTLMPWCATEGDCLLAYYTLYRPADRHQTKIERLRAAKKWDASVRTKDFVTWTDVPMQQQHTQKQVEEQAAEAARAATAAAEAARAATAADAIVMAEARRQSANEAQRKAEAATSALERATAKFEEAQANSGKGRRGQKRSRYTYICPFPRSYPNTDAPFILTTHCVGTQDRHQKKVISLPSLPQRRRTLFKSLQKRDLRQKDNV